MAEEAPDLREKEDVERFEAKIVEAEEVSKVREIEIGGAGQKAYDEASEIKDAAKVVILKNRPAKFAREGNILDEGEVAKVEKRRFSS